MRITEHGGSAPISVDAIARHEHSPHPTEQPTSPVLPDAVKAAPAVDLMDQASRMPGVADLMDLHRQYAMQAVNQYKNGSATYWSELATPISAPLSDDELAAIRKRHEKRSAFYIVDASVREMHADRGRLLAHIEHLQQRIAELER